MEVWVKKFVQVPLAPLAVPVPDENFYVLQMTNGLCQCQWLARASGNLKIVLNSSIFCSAERTPVVRLVTLKNTPTSAPLLTSVTTYTQRRSLRFNNY